MSLQELIPNVKALSKTDKLRLLQVLAHELAKDEKLEVFEDGGIYPIWSPFDAYEAANQLSQFIKDAEKKAGESG